MWSRRCAPVTSRAAAFWTVDCRWRRTALSTLAVVFQYFNIANSNDPRNTIAQPSINILLRAATQNLGRSNTFVEGADKVISVH